MLVPGPAPPFRAQQLTVGMECGNLPNITRQRSLLRPSPGRVVRGRILSLVEVMIAIVILAVAVVGLTQGFTTALASSKDSEQQTTAALFAAGQIESLRASTGLTDETTEGDCGDELPLYRWRQTISPAGVDGLHEVTVAVEHTKTGALIYELKTLLFEVPATAPEKSQKPKSKEGPANEHGASNTASGSAPSWAQQPTAGMERWNFPKTTRCWSLLRPGRARSGRCAPAPGSP